MPNPERPPLTEEEIEQKKKLEEIRKKIELSRQKLLQKHNADIQKGLKQLS